MEYQAKAETDMKLITNARRIQLLENGRKSRAIDDFDTTPMVKLFTPDASATQPFTELDPRSRSTPSACPTSDSTAPTKAAPPF